MRIPVKYIANLLAAGNEALVLESLKKQMAVRMYWRQKRVGDVGEGAVRNALTATGLSEEDVHGIYRINSLATYNERFVIPETHRENKTTVDPRNMYEKRGVDPRNMYEKRGAVGFGPKRKEFPSREW